MIKPDDLQKALEQKAKTLEQWSEELRKLIPKNPLKVAFDSSKWKRYEKVQQKPLVTLEDVKELFSAFQRDQTAKLERAIKNLVPQKQYYDFEVERILRKLDGSEETK